MRKIFVPLIVALALLAAMIAPVQAPAQAQDATLRMGLLPILDVLPFYVAEQAGYFEDAGLNVELIPVSSALERDQLLLAGEIDGMLNDLISTGIFNQDGSRIQIVAQARRAYVEAPQFRILAAPDSELYEPNDLFGVEIAISENSVIHYIAQRIMEDAGLFAEELSFRPEPNIPVRFQLLMEGTIQAACLPDPLAQAAIEGGAHLIADDSELAGTEFSQSVLSFRTEVIEDNPDAVKAFLTVWMRAAEDINADPEAYRDLWLEKTNVPDSVRDTYVLPPFPTYAITDDFAWEDAVNWLVELGIVDNAASYEDSVNQTLLAEVIEEAGIGAEASNGEPVVVPEGNAESGATLFASYGCAGCHAVDDPNAAGAGPSLAMIGVEAGSRVEGLDAAAYLEQSIRDPGAFVVEGYNNIMPTYPNLNAGDLADLVAFLSSLGQNQPDTPPADTTDSGAAG